MHRESFDVFPRDPSRPEFYDGERRRKRESFAWGGEQRSDEKSGMRGRIAYEEKCGVWAT